MSEGTWLDVQEAAQSAFDKMKDDIDNPVYEIEKGAITESCGSPNPK